MEMLLRLEQGILLCLNLNKKRLSKSIEAPLFYAMFYSIMTIILDNSSQNYKLHLIFVLYLL